MRAISSFSKRKMPITGKPLEGLCILDDHKAAQLTNVAIATLKGETLLRRYVRLSGVDDDKPVQDIEAMLATLLEEDGYGIDVG